LSGSILIIRQLVRFNQRPVYMAGLASVSGAACLSGPMYVSRLHLLVKKC
jgi:hypothetical protein